MTAVLFHALPRRADAAGFRTAAVRWRGAEFRE
jgi:hypothetical protein